MRGLQDIFQVVGKPVFLILFLFGFLGSQCGRVTGGGSDSPTPNTEQVLSEQQAKVDAAAKAAEAARKEVEAARQAGDAAKAAEAERKQKEAEAEAEKQRQIQTALETAAPAVLRANEAVKRVAAAKEQVEGTRLTSGRPFPVLEEKVNAAKKEALSAFGAISRSEEVSAAFDKSEEVSLAANRADQQARIAEEFVSRFQSLFTFNANEKTLVPGDPETEEYTLRRQFASQCNDFFLQELFQNMPPDLKPPGGYLLKDAVCVWTSQGGSFKSVNCFCAYDRGGKFFTGNNRLWVEHRFPLNRS